MTIAKTQEAALLFRCPKCRRQPHFHCVSVWRKRGGGLGEKTLKHPHPERIQLLAGHSFGLAVTHPGRFAWICTCGAKGERDSRDLTTAELKAEAWKEYKRHLERAINGRGGDHSEQEPPPGQQP